MCPSGQARDISIALGTRRARSKRGHFGGLARNYANSPKNSVERRSLFPCYVHTSLLFPRMRKEPLKPKSRNSPPPPPPPPSRVWAGSPFPLKWGRWEEKGDDDERHICKNSARSSGKLAREPEFSQRPEEGPTFKVLEKLGFDRSSLKPVKRRKWAAF